jgi:hypothetical protein
VPKIEQSVSQQDFIAWDAVPTLRKHHQILSGKRSYSVVLRNFYGIAAGHD